MELCYSLFHIPAAYVQSVLGINIDKPMLKNVLILGIILDK